MIIIPLVAKKFTMKYYKKMDEILKMSKEINYGKLVYDFKRPTPSINFAIF